MKLRKYVFLTLIILLFSSVILFTNALHINDKTNEHKMMLNYDRKTITDNTKNSGEDKIDASEYTR